MAADILSSLPTCKSLVVLCVLKGGQLVYIYISHKTKGCDIWPALKSQLEALLNWGAFCYIRLSCLIY